MGRRNRYFLVAREKETNIFDIVPVTDGYGSSLEEIDLFTTHFDSEKSLIQALKIDGKVKSDSLDLFITHQSGTKGNEKMFSQEVLYSDNQRICPIAKASYRGNIEDEKDDIRSIFREFCTKMMHDQSFFNMVLFGHTNLYSKFITNFMDKRFLDSFSVQYKNGGWILKSYPTIRGMLESFSFYQRDPYGEEFKEKNRYRQLLEEELLTVTKNDYNPNQINFFDLLDEKVRVKNNFS